MKPFVKWPGGKSEELNIIKQFAPKDIDAFYEPFVGGGAVYLSDIQRNRSYINDKSTELYLLYIYIKNRNVNFFNALNTINNIWKESEIFFQNNILFFNNFYNNLNDKKKLEKEIFEICSSFCVDNDEKFVDELYRQISIHAAAKMLRTQKLENTKGRISLDDLNANLLSGIKAGIYTHFRNLYNHYNDFNLSEEEHIALFFFLREFCYSSMFRYNAKGEFNVPFGGLSYNKKNLDYKIEMMNNPELIDLLNKTVIENKDFADVFPDKTLTENDFIFLDPPYDTDFSTYANNKFVSNDQIRLANFCKSTKARFMLVIKNTDFIYNLYKDFNIISFDKKYSVSFRNRNNQDCTHLLITNYKTE